MVKGRPQRRRRNNGNRRRFSRRGNLRMLNARKFSPTADPRAVSLYPWYSQTVQWLATIEKDSTATITGLNIHDIVKHYTTITADIDVRIAAFTVYDCAARVLSVIFMDLLTHQILSQITDLPGRNTFTRVGLRYPKAQSEFSIPADDNVLLILQVGDTLGTATESKKQVLIRCQLLWRPKPTLSGFKLRSVKLTPLKEQSEFKATMD